jgi:hypothetical protein
MTQKIDVVAWRCFWLTGIEHDDRRRRQMTTSYKFYNSWVESTVEVHADGSLTEMAGWWLRTSVLDTMWGGPGTVFPTFAAWVAAMVAETDKRYPWYAGRHNYKLAYLPEDTGARSSVVWVPSKKHYMEIRRGSQTKFAATERRYWLSVEEWLDSLTPAPLTKAEVPAAVPVMVVSEVPAAAPVVAAFNPEKFKKDFDGLIAWARDKSAQTKAAAIVQICHWLLEMKARPGSTYRADGRSDLAMWLEETPVWRVSIRAIVQAREWEWTTPASAAAVAAFLEKF